MGRTATKNPQKPPKLDPNIVVERVEAFRRKKSSVRLACQSVARQLGANYHEVCKCYDRHRTRLKGHHGNRLLSFEANRLLLALVIAFSAAHMALTVPQLRHQVDVHYGIKMAKQTAYNWADRHRRWIKKRKTKQLARGRVSDDIVDDCQAFCELFKAAGNEFQMSAKNVINYDETRVMVGTGGEYRLERVGKDRAQVRKEKGRTLGSLLTFVSAEGKVLMSVWIIKGKKGCGNDKNLLEADFHIPATSYELRSDVLRFYAVTATGYSNTDLQKSAISKFCEIWALRHPGLHCYLLGDQLRCHQDIATIKAALTNNVFMWLLPANASHFLQPLDHACFALFKKKIRAADVGVRLGGHKSTPDSLAGLYSVAYEAERAALMPRVIQRAFESTGIWPFRPVKIMELARANAGEVEHAERTAYDARAADMMTKALQAREQAAGPQKPVRRNKAKHDGKSIFSPHQLLEKAAAQKAEAAAAKETAKKKRLDKAKAKAAAKKARTCWATRCDKVSRSSRVSSKWKKCSECPARYCPAHQRAYTLHTKKHEKEAQPVPMDVVK